MAEFGRVDGLVNNAGVGTATPAARETPEEFRSVIDVNLNGAFWVAQACGTGHAARMLDRERRERPRAVDPGLSAGGLRASKAGVIGLTRDLAQQWGSRRVSG